MRRYEHGGDICGNDGVLLDFSVNTNPFGLPESVKKTIAEHISEYARYPDPNCRVLKSALAEKHGIKVSQILCGNGASELILALCACVKPHDALVTVPTFSEYERAASLYGANVREYRLSEKDGFALTDEFLAVLEPAPDILFLCNPNNPTGRLIDTMLLHKIAAICRDNGTLLLLDECFIDFTDGESMLPWLFEHPNLLILRAFTKIYAMAGLRLGVLYGEEKLIAQISSFCPPWNVSIPAQLAGVTALKERGWIENTRRLVETEREFMTQALCQSGLTVFTSDANFLLVKSETPLYNPLRARGVLVRPCANFTGLNEQYIRVGLKTREMNTALLRAITEVLHG